MADIINFKLITPEAVVLSEKITAAQLPLHDGQAGILPRRAPLMAKVGLGELRVDFPAGGSRSYVVDGGFVQMVGDKLTLLAESALPAEQLSEQEASAELAEAEARKPQTAGEMERIAHERRRARLKVDLARRVRTSGI
ncbi:MAG: F0F1 ATP synthase subunit epsilon [Planctomycetota bacterium]|nr:F0F1 ATP synthase subunit epsilon [Planctomycetota bacterium]